MTTAWDPWPSSPPSVSPLARSPMSPSALAGASWSPRASFDRSWALTARLSSTAVNVPILPPEIIRRIIRHALALPPSSPPRIPRVRRDSDSSYEGDDAVNSNNNNNNNISKLNRVEQCRSIPVPTPEWDLYAGMAAARARQKEAAAREGVMRTARTLLRVCRAWKPLVTRYLYSEPHVSADNVVALARAVVHGDRKWSDLHVNPHSYPGRWLTTLDLSHIGPGGYYCTDAVSMSRAVAALLELAPSVTHLRLAPHGWRLDDLLMAPSMRKLQVLEGLHVGVGCEEDVVKVLRVAKSLEVLGLVWLGSASSPTPPLDDEVDDVDVVGLAIDEQPTKPRRDLELPYLHTLNLVGGRPGPLLAALTRADLPNLTRLVTSPYESSLAAFDDDPDRGGPRALQVAHGHKILSLAYVSTLDWPRSNLLPPPDTLMLHTGLVHLHLALPHSLLNQHPELAAALGSSQHHPLTAVTLPRWPRVVAGAEMSPHPALPAAHHGDGPPAPQGNTFLAALCARPSHIKTISVEGFTWVQPALGRWAAESGDSGMMRQWAGWLGRAGVELRDSEGNTAPVIERGRETRGGPWGGRRSVDGGGGRRRSNG